jgi:ribonuclease Z
MFTDIQRDDSYGLPTGLARAAAAKGTTPRVQPARMIVLSIGALFAALAAGIWVAPDAAAQALSLEFARSSGSTAVRAEVGGLFAGLAVLSLVAGFRRSRGFALAAAIVVAAVAMGRVVGMVAVGRTEGHVPALIVEAAAIAALLLYARGLARAGQRATGTRRRLLIGWGIALGGAVLVVTAALDARVEMFLFERGAAAVNARDNSFLLGDDALRVAVCGSSAPLPSAGRAKACVAVFAGGRYYLVDVGPESVENLVNWSVPLGEIGGVLLTHFHSDHIGDLGELNLQTWANGRRAPLPVYGGPGVERVVDGFNAAYSLDQGYRTDHHTAAVMVPANWPMLARAIQLGAPNAAKNRTGLVLEDGDLRITAIEVDHAPISPAYAYRFDYRGRSVVVTGDLKFHPPLVAAATGADVLISEAIARPMLEAVQRGAAAAGRPRQATILHDIQDYHLSPSEASEIADAAGVKLLVFYHLLPAPDSALARRLFGHDVGRKGEWTIASDGSLYTLPLGSDVVRMGRID